MSTPRPAARPRVPHFSSGPCAKRPGYALENLKNATLGRSHRSKEGKAKLKLAIDKTRAILGVPQDYLIGITAASDTGAFEMAMWSMLGARGIDVLAWESFGQGWVSDVLKELKLQDVRSFTADYGELPDLTGIEFSRDVIFTWNGTTSGVRVPEGDWIAEDREGLTICDATSAAFAMPLPWHKLDVATFSWQKALGSEGAHGMLILGPRAVERLESYTPPWPLPKIFRLTKDAKIIEGIFEGETINTPSMLALEDYIFALEWAKEIGGLDALFARADANAAALDAWVEAADWIEHAVADPAIRSTTSVCLKFANAVGLDADARRAIEKRVVGLLDGEGVAFDIGSYREAPPGLRIWCGPTVDAEDIAALGPWLDWAWREARSL